DCLHQKASCAHRILKGKSHRLRPQKRLILFLGTKAFMDELVMLVRETLNTKAKRAIYALYNYLGDLIAHFQPKSRDNRVKIELSADIAREVINCAIAQGREHKRLNDGSVIIKYDEHGRRGGWSIPFWSNEKLPEDSFRIIVGHQPFDVLVDDYWAAENAKSK